MPFKILSLLGCIGVLLASVAIAEETSLTVFVASSETGPILAYVEPAPEAPVSWTIYRNGQLLQADQDFWAAKRAVVVGEPLSGKYFFVANAAEQNGAEHIDLENREPLAEGTLNLVAIKSKVGHPMAICLQGQPAGEVSWTVLRNGAAVAADDNRLQRLPGAVVIDSSVASDQSYTVSATVASAQDPIQPPVQLELTVALQEAGDSVDPNDQPLLVDDDIVNMPDDGQGEGGEVNPNAPLLGEVNDAARDFGVERVVDEYLEAAVKNRSITFDQQIDITTMKFSQMFDELIKFVKSNAKEGKLDAEGLAKLKSLYTSKYEAIIDSSLPTTKLARQKLWNPLYNSLSEQIEQARDNITERGLDITSAADWEQVFAELGIVFNKWSQRFLINRTLTEENLQAMKAAEVARGRAGGGGGYSFSSYGYASSASHAAVRHARIMSRIGRHQERHSYRIERIRAR